MRHAQLDHLMLDGTAVYICDELHTGDKTLKHVKNWTILWTYTYRIKVLRIFADPFSGTEVAGDLLRTRSAEAACSLRQQCCSNYFNLQTRTFDRWDQKNN